MFIERRAILQRGTTLVELIMFIIIVSVGVVGLVSTMNPLIRHSADPMLTKQMTTIAESLLNEVLHQAFTWCDPDDSAAATATSASACTDDQNKAGAALTAPTPATETRLTFDNVADYGNFVQADIADAAGNNAMPGYRAEVAVARAGTAFDLADDSVLRVTVTVKRAGQADFALTGYRFRYAPRY